jgi:hypothetical protein
MAIVLANPAGNTPQGELTERNALVRLGVSGLGAYQLMRGQVVTGTEDRRRLAGIIGVLLDLKAGQKVSGVALLLPAVQAAREAARRMQKLQEVGLSAAGAHQFITGLPVTNMEDRQALGLALSSAISESHGGYKGGGYNQLIMNDTQGREK